MALILVIEEFDLLRGVLRRMLECRHHRVLLAADGPEGLKLWQDRAPDVVLLDMDRPDGASMAVLRQFRSLAPELPIIAMSAGGMTGRFDRVANAQLLGAAGALMKPFHILDVNELVACVVGHDGGEGPETRQAGHSDVALLTRNRYREPNDDRQS